jgi:hypothetical protein
MAHFDPLWVSGRGARLKEQWGFDYSCLKSKKRLNGRGENPVFGCSQKRSGMPSSTLIRTKLYRPPTTKDVVGHAELYQRLEEGRHLPLTLQRRKKEYRAANAA